MGWMFLFGMIGTGLVGPNRSSIEREFGLTHGQFGAAFALVQIVCSVLALAFAACSRRFDNVGALLASLMIQSAGFALVWGSRSSAGLIGGWTLITLGLVLGAVANNVSAWLWPDDPRRGVTLLHGFNGLGKVAGPLVAAACLALGWRLSFLVVGAITLLLALAFVSQRERFRAVLTDADRVRQPQSEASAR
jgi:MFS family permease